MLARLLLILAFAWQPLSLWRAAERTAHPVDCVETLCCTTVERVTCCGEKTIERVCGITGGDCVCASSSSDAPLPAPNAPMPRNERENLAATSPPSSYGVALACSADAPRPLFALSESRLAGITHNRVQAILGVWRT